MGSRGTKRARVEDDQSSLPAVSLGKPSLKARLEAYYALVSPDQLQDEGGEWRSKFEQIWAKFGGTREGEQKLAAKLTKKYGSAVLFLTVASHEERREQQQQQQDDSNSKQRSAEQQNAVQHSEDWFELNEKEQSSGCLDFTSDCFDPLAALQPSNAHQFLALHPYFSSAPMLDRVDQFRSYLPVTDPLFRPITTKAKRQSSSINNDTAASNKGKKVPSCFAATATLHSSGGPLSVLYRAFEKRQRIRVVTRYVHGIRGTLTGYLIAFDKHMNMILQDADEHYSPPKRKRIATAGGDGDTDAGMSNFDAELRRRQRALTSPQSTGPDWTLRQRHLRQVLVRGDNVVLVYAAAAERSAFPVTSQSPRESRYRQQSEQQQSLPDRERVGTPGSLIYAAQRRPSSHRQQQQQHHQQRKRDYLS